MRHIGRKGDNCKSNIGRQGVVVSVSKGLPNAAAAAHSGIEMVAKACNVHSSRGRVAGDRQTRAESPAGQIQLELLGESQDKVLEPVLLPPVPLGQRAEDFPQIERFVPRHRKVDMSFLSSKNLVRFIFESFPINLRYCSRSCFPSSSWTFSCN